MALSLLMAFPVWGEELAKSEENIETTAVEEIAANDPDDYARNVVEFEDDLLRMMGHNKVDLERFTFGSSATPGKYRVSIFVNDVQMANDEVEFKEASNKRVYPCLTPKLVRLINLKEDRLSTEARETIEAAHPCTDIEKLIPQAKVEFDSSEQRLNITVPQAMVNRTMRGAVSPELWESGIPALTLGYYLSGYDSSYSGYDSRSLFASLNAGLNIGAWQLRHNGSYNWDKNQGGKYNVTNTYIQRDIAALRSQFVAGESNTTGQIFSSVPFIGARINSDSRMLPDVQRGYAPEIRGVAKTNAKVTVRQLGNVIYETTVTPGAFIIDDLYPAGYGGDLEITIKEADGSVQQYTMAYASVAQLLRPGVQEYSFTAGKLRETNLSTEPVFYEATYQRGLSNYLTGYGGVQFSKHYQSAQLGTAVGSVIGALSADVTWSNSDVGKKGGGKLQGQSYRISYSKLINETDSNITLAAYRFSSKNYMEFLTALQARDYVKEGYSVDSIWRSKNRFNISLNQGLPDGWGSVYASATMENYWNSKQGYNKYYQIGYSNNFWRFNYSISAGRSKTASGREQTNFYLGLSMPLWDSFETRAPYLSLRYNQNSDGGKGEQAMVSGTFGENNKYNYNMAASHDNYSGTSTTMGLGWQGSAATMNGSYSQGRNYKSTSLSMNGAAVVHSGGVTLSPINNDTFALIEAKGAEGARVAGYASSKVDMFGYALYPGLVPYSMNSVAIDPEGSSLDVEFESTSQTVVPRAGAVVKVKFDTHRGTAVLIRSTFGGEPVPFGAEVFNDKNANVGTVTQGGLIYARVEEEKGTLVVKWGEEMHNRCQVSYVLAPEPKDKEMQGLPQQFTMPCQTYQAPGRSGHSGGTLAAVTP
ncbi:fimbria/pilus outer membrane usher protein [Citrobacter sp. MNAZ 1397]|uniref:fimbria/pilus outer membrane usher protein n=1 Tax=Citrobacter sp. MNAZ 1397 TaxID=2911205 RepID=UPI00202752BA|nr:fimbrial biogenesis outer membrane usher protein [Citrobacter sp. MNAZ 1397]